MEYIPKTCVRFQNHAPYLLQTTAPAHNSNMRRFRWCGINRDRGTLCDSRYTVARCMVVLSTEYFPLVDLFINIGSPNYLACFVFLVYYNYVQLISYPNINLSNLTFCKHAIQKRVKFYLLGH